MDKLAVTLLFLCSCAPSRGELLRAQYRAHALSPETAASCLDAPSRCPGYGKTYWRMPRADVQRATGCLTLGLDCVLAVGSAERTLDERYVFRNGHLSGVVIDFPSWDAAMESLSPSLGDPGWEGSNREAYDARLSDAKEHELSLMVAGALGALAGSDHAFGWFVAREEAREQRRELEAERRATPALHCATWQREVTSVLLCEEQGRRTTALFTSRLEPDRGRLSDYRTPH